MANTDCKLHWACLGEIVESWGICGELPWWAEVGRQTHPLTGRIILWAEVLYCIKLRKITRVRTHPTPPSDGRWSVTSYLKVFPLWLPAMRLLFTLGWWPHINPSFFKLLWLGYFITESEQWLVNVHNPFMSGDKVYNFVSHSVRWTSPMGMVHLGRRTGFL